MTFKWIKQRAYNSRALAAGEERYFLNVGDVYGGLVFTRHDGDKYLGWSAEYHVCGKMLSGRSGGGMTRDDGFAFVEMMVAAALEEVRSVGKDQHREIYDSLLETDDKTGELSRKRLE